MPKGKPDEGKVGDGGTFPLNITEIRKLRGTDRADALRIYHRWLKEQRKKDKRHTQNQINRSYFREAVMLKKKHNLPLSNHKSRCIDCGKNVSRYSFRCMECNAKVQTGRKKAKTTGKFGGAFGKRKRHKKITNKKAQSQTVFFFIALILLLIVYILALPPEYRLILLS